MDGPLPAPAAANRRSGTTLDGRGCLLLDGGLASELERAGHDLNDPLWSARVLLEDPAAVEGVHRAFLEAGADCITTATYQATFQGLAARGLTADEAERLLLRAVELAVRARDRFCAESARPHRPLVAASIGPYGAYLADGSEYRGDYGLGRAALAGFHRRRWEVLARSGADVLLCETLPALEEARALAALAREGAARAGEGTAPTRVGAAPARAMGAPAGVGAAVPVWFSFTCRDEAHLSDGTPIGKVAAWAEACDVVAAVGVNCTAPRFLPGLIAALAAGTGKPILAYPNAGGDWDAAAKRWGGAEGAADWGEACRAWIAAGAAGVGGCCRVGAGGSGRCARRSRPEREPGRLPLEPPNA